MKKLLYAAIAAIGLLLSPACSNEDELSNDNEALVSFNVGVENGMQTKAAGTYTIGNADLINTLHVRVYYDDGNDGIGTEIADFSKDQSFNGTANLSFNLLRGQKYHFLFFADHQATEGGTGTSPYTIQDGGAIKVRYDDALCNDETRDAFVETLSVTATGSFTHSVKLRRPFAQLNFLTTAKDIQAAAAGKIVDNIVTTPLKTRVIINNAAETYNPFTKKVNGSTTATFGENKAPFTVTHDGEQGTSASNYIVSSNYGTLSVKGTSGYYYLATAYFLVNTGEGETEATTQTTLNSVKLEVYGTDVPALDVPSAKVQQNYRTNIYGSLLTDPGNFQVTITPAFEDEHNEPANTEDPELPTDPATVYVSSVEELTNALNTAEVIKLNRMIHLSNDLEVSRSVTIDGQNQTYGFTGAGSVVVKAPAEDAVTFSGVIFNNAAYENTTSNQKYALTSVEGIQCDITVENCVFANYTYGAVFLQPYFYPNGSGVCSTILIEGNSFTTPINTIQGEYLKVCSTTTQNGSLRNQWTGGGTTNEPVSATLKILNNKFGQTGAKVGYAIYTKFISRYSTYVGGNKIDENETFDIFKTNLHFEGNSEYSLRSDFESMFTGNSESQLEKLPGT